ncbi:MAG: aconitate hydratase AcnA [Rhodobacteraceae bacterium]|nr:aconitate hydratase AcnA [Paracoccaceae bacterium]MBR9820096.1 aconitate hydratase AcnA [Paracoccaceae bacterium]
MRARFTTDPGTGARMVDLPASAGEVLPRLPHVLRLLLETVLRTATPEEAAEPAAAIAAWPARGRGEGVIPVRPGRVMMHDTTCGPALVDIAAMRDALAEAGADPSALNPVLPVDVSTDHSLAVDVHARPGARLANLRAEYDRNGERYGFMKWATGALRGFRVHPPGTGIMHTLNLERLAEVVSLRDGWLCPDVMIGTDSHTPMVNGIGVLAWGVGGIEAESVLFGLPVTLRLPEVIGVRLTGRLGPGVLSTDLALSVTERLRRFGMEGRFAEFFGPGVATLSAGDRAVVANMTPEFGGATGFFPVDGAVLDYLRQTGRNEDHLARVEGYCRRQGLWFDPGASPRFTEVIEIPLDEIESSLAGPSRPQDRIRAGATRQALALADPPPRQGAEPPEGAARVMPRAPVAIAAITSCTNTTDPRLLIAAGLVARNARRRGLVPPSWVKTSLAPGSPGAERMLRRAGLLEDLEALGFGVVGIGCTSCIGNSGPLAPAMQAALQEDPGLRPVAVISGNRNFPRRVHGAIGDAFLGSPPLVVAFALAGDAACDIEADPLAPGVRLADLWPEGAEVDRLLAQVRDPAETARAYAEAEADPAWQALGAPTGDRYPWDPRSTYIRRPPFVALGVGNRLGRYRAAPLAVFGDDITTDHISPAGAIPAEGAAGRYLLARGATAGALNVFSSRRGNWEVMLRGLFTNPSAVNRLAPDLPPGWAPDPQGRALPLWQAARAFTEAEVPLVLVAGARYGMGSSRDWAAKGVALLGVRAVLAGSFERIHRSNLIGMGILPLRLPADLGPEALALVPGDRLLIDAPADRIGVDAPVAVRLDRAEGDGPGFTATAAIETEDELRTLVAGGMFPRLLGALTGATGASA